MFTPGEIVVLNGEEFKVVVAPDATETMLLQRVPKTPPPWVDPRIKVLKDAFEKWANAPYEEGEPSTFCEDTGVECKCLNDTNIRYLLDALDEWEDDQLYSF